MPRQAQLEDGTILEFPDETPDYVMDRAVRQHLGTDGPKAITRRKKAIPESGYIEDGVNRYRGMQVNANVGMAHGLKLSALGVGQFIASGGPIAGPMMDFERKYVPGMKPQQTVGGLVSGAAPARGEYDYSGKIEDYLGNAAKQSREKFENTRAGQSLAGKSGAVVAQYGPGMAFPGGAAKTVFGKILAGVTSGAFQGAIQPVEPGQSRTENVAVSAAGGGVANAGVGLLAKAAKNAKLPAPIKAAVDLARRMKIPLHVSQVSNSRALKGASSVLNNLPLSGGARANEVQQVAFNRALGKTFGVNADYLTDDVVQAGKAKIGDVYNDIWSRNRATLHPADVKQLIALENSARQNLTQDQSAVVSNQVQKIIDEFSQGNITGSKYQSLRESLADAADDGKTGAAIKKLRMVLDNAALRSVGGKDADRLRTANQQWANARTAEDALKQVAGAGGNVKPSALWPLVRNGSTKDMRDLAKVGQLVLKDPIPNSGTPERQMWIGLTGLGGGATTGLTAPAAAGLGVGALGARVLNSNVASRVLQDGNAARAAAGLSSGLSRAAPAAAIEANKKRKKK
jgi:hypothetical protein